MTIRNLAFFLHFSFCFCLNDYIKKKTHTSGGLIPLFMVASFFLSSPPFFLGGGTTTNHTVNIPPAPARRAYGELGSVERENVCCFVGFTSNLSPTKSEGGGQAAIIPGNCCETALVNEIVEELKKR